MLVPARKRCKTLPASRVVRLNTRLLACCVLTGSLLSVAFLHPAKSFAQESNTEDEVVRVSTDLLLFPIRIKDKKDQAVKGLTEGELSLEDKDQVTTGLYFAPGADRVALVFALDQSGSLRQIISQQRAPSNFEI